MIKRVNCPLLASPFQEPLLQTATRRCMRRPERLLNRGINKACGRMYKNGHVVCRINTYIRHRLGVGATKALQVAMVQQQWTLEFMSLNLCHFMIALLASVPAGRGPHRVRSI